ncbi:hypothetical protein SAMN05421789_102325 [Kaistella chaponensis]|uniref:GAPS4b N-terminal domain-containing protein n=1 Tax=Kaistella chaponensis TaxID=713588 RepID=A0A1N7JU91_9FLAO|nr:hypothetical protein [Kaistella chaponensis]SIS52900.1 hypothetical protein SAMN05421789_102325 [Kaistella chaponensis]
MEEKLEIDKFIPFGVELKEILHHRNITPTKQRNFLKSRGIFMNTNDSSAFAATFSSLVLSPNEFEKIKDLVRRKENSEKTATRNLPFDCDKKLIEALPDILPLNGLFENSNFKISNISNFSTIDGNQDHVYCTIDCDTTNYNSSWYRNRNEYKAEIIIKRIEGEKNVTFLLKYSSPETFEIVDCLSKEIVKDFKRKSYTKETDNFQKITFGNFNNETRITFLLKLIEDSTHFTFQKMTNIDIAPDVNKKLPDLLQKFMSGGVQNLKIQGNNLLNNFLISETDNHDFVELAGIDVLFNFSYSGAKGKCSVFYGFQNYFQKRNSSIEFHVDIYDIKLNKEFSHVNKLNVKKFLNQEFEKIKNIKFKEINDKG